MVNILAVLPAKVQVDNSQNTRTAQLIGGVLGAAGGAFAGASFRHASLLGGTLGAVGGGFVGTAVGSLVPGQVLVAGISITYDENGKMFNSAQVGRQCEYAPGRAILVAMSGAETRIQPNASCPPQKT